MTRPRTKNCLKSAPKLRGGDLLMVTSPDNPSSQPLPWDPIRPADATRSPLRVQRPESPRDQALALSSASPLRIALSSPSRVLRRLGDVAKFFLVPRRACSRYVPDPRADSFGSSEMG